MRCSEVFGRGWRTNWSERKMDAKARDCES